MGEPSLMKTIFLKLVFMQCDKSIEAPESCEDYTISLLKYRRNIRRALKNRQKSLETPVKDSDGIDDECENTERTIEFEGG